MAAAAVFRYLDGAFAKSRHNANRVKDGIPRHRRESGGKPPIEEKGCRFAGVDTRAGLSDGCARLTGFSGSDTPIPLAFADGAYSFSPEDESQMIAVIAAEMCGDGNLKMTLDFGLNEMVLIMARAEAVGEPAA